MDKEHPPLRHLLSSFLYHQPEFSTVAPANIDGVSEVQISQLRTDELGRLAKDLSTMTESLRELTVSREMLSRENQERKRADILDFLPDDTLARKAREVLDT